MQLTLCIVTKNKSMHTTTLHSAMTLNMICMTRGIHLSIQFIENSESNIQKILKTCDRLIWIDYGVSVTQQTLERLLETNDWNISVVPCVTNEVDWDQFRKKTLSSECNEPVHQRALKFDIESRPIQKKNDVLEYVSGTPRVFCVDSKPVLKKLRDTDTSFKSMDQLKKMGVKICVLKSETVTCHYVYECIGNILESSGVRTSK